MAEMSDTYGDMIGGWGVKAAGKSHDDDDDEEKGDDN